MLRSLTSRMKQIAREHRQPSDGLEGVQAFRKLLAEVITREGSMTGAAKVLGVNPAQLSNWCNWLDVERRVERTTTARTVARAS